MPKTIISVIVPIYNSEKYLHKCLDSIVNQTYANLEIILVNDGSSDSSGLIIDDYALKDNRIIVIHKGNGGIGSAYNLAFKRMTGDYISFVDSDDYISPKMYEELSDVITKEKPDLLHFGIKVFNENGDNINLASFKSLDKIIVGNDLIIETHYKILKHPSLVRLFKKELFENIIIFEQNIGIDEMLTPQLLLKCNKAVYTSKPYYYVLARQDSICRAEYTLKKVTETIRVYRFLTQFMEQNINTYAYISWFKYLQTLVGIVHSSLRDYNLLEPAIKSEIFYDLKLSYKHVKSTEIFKAQSWLLRYRSALISKYPAVYKQLWRFYSFLKIDTN